MKLHQIFKIALYILGFSLAMKLLVKFVFISDKSRSEIENWLSNQSNVTEIVGDNMSYRLKKRVEVKPSEKKPGYSLYTFIISGDSGKATAIVLAETEKNDFYLKTLKEN